MHSIPGRLRTPCVPAKLPGLSRLSEFRIQRRHFRATALEAGAEAVIIPMVRSASDVRNIVDFLTFPPAGKRGLCPGLRVPGYSVTLFNDYMRESNDNLYVIPMIETVTDSTTLRKFVPFPRLEPLYSHRESCLLQWVRGPQRTAALRFQAAHQTVLMAAKRHDVAMIGGPIFNPTLKAAGKHSRTDLHPLHRT